MNVIADTSLDKGVFDVWIRVCTAARTIVYVAIVRAITELQVLLLVLVLFRQKLI